MPFDTTTSGTGYRATSGLVERSRLTEFMPQADGLAVWALGATVVALIIVRMVLDRANSRD